MGNKKTKAPFGIIIDKARENPEIEIRDRSGVIAYEIALVDVLNDLKKQIARGTRGTGIFVKIDDIVDVLTKLRLGSGQRIKKLYENGI